MVGGPVAIDMEALHWERIGDETVQCKLCPHECRINNGSRGICGIRINRNGKLIAAGYGIYPAVHMDPIEKKPLNHFLPGSNILSLGSIGCNMTCQHCQNWSLSRERPEGMEAYYIPPDLLIKKAMDRGGIGVAFTYNEPTINFEYIMEVSPKLRERGAKVVHVTNGHLSKGPSKEPVLAWPSHQPDKEDTRDEKKRGEAPQGKPGRRWHVEILATSANVPEG